MNIFLHTNIKWMNTESVINNYCHKLCFLSHPPNIYTWMIMNFSLLLVSCLETKLCLLSFNDSFTRIYLKLFSIVVIIFTSKIRRHYLFWEPFNFWPPYTLWPLDLYLYATRDTYCFAVVISDGSRELYYPLLCLADYILCI